MKLNSFLSRAILLTLSVATLSACRKDAPKDDLPTPVGPAPSVASGRLTALRPPVEFRVRELSEGRALDKGDSVDVQPGANIVNGVGGHADLTWAEFMNLDMATGTDLLVSLVQPASGQATIDQATGTVRYRLLGDNPQALLNIQAATWVSVQVKKAPADVIVSLMPGPEPAAWVAVIKGTVEVRRGADKLRVKGGQAAAFTEKGALPPLMDLGREALNDWFDDYASGKNPQSMAAEFLFRCTVTGEGTRLRPAPDGTALGAVLDLGTLVQVSGRSADSGWVFIKTEEGADGWLAAADLSCNGPLADLAVDDGAASPAATAAVVATAARPLAVVTASPTPRRTATVPITTATASPTAAAPIINLSADKTDLAAGECTNLRWSVKGVRSYSVNGAGKAGDTGSEKVCPKQNTTYTLTAVLPDGSEVSQSVKIKVRTAEATAAPTTAASTAAPTAATTATPKPPPGPTAPPTAISLPTDPPAPTDEPTQEPSPQPAASATP